jgi:hypothetical protein
MQESTVVFRGDKLFGGVSAFVAKEGTVIQISEK